MNLEIHKTAQENQVIVLKLKGEVDVYTAPKLKEQLLSLFDVKNTAVTIDLSHVDYMDSTGLGVLIGGLKAAKANEGHIKLVNATPRLERLFSITGLADVIEIRQGEEV